MVDRSNMETLVRFASQYLSGSSSAAETASHDSPAIRPPPYCTEFECGDFWRRGHAHST